MSEVIFEWRALSDMEAFAKVDLSVQIKEKCGRNRFDWLKFQEFSKKYFGVI